MNPNHYTKQTASSHALRWQSMVKDDIAAHGQWDIFTNQVSMPIRLGADKSIALFNISYAKSLGFWGKDQDTSASDLYIRKMKDQDNGDKEDDGEFENDETGEGEDTGEFDEGDDEGAAFPDDDDEFNQDTEEDELLENHDGSGGDEERAGDDEGIEEDVDDEDIYEDDDEGDFEWDDDEEDDDDDDFDEDEDLGTMNAVTSPETTYSATFTEADDPSQPTDLIKERA